MSPPSRKEPLGSDQVPPRLSERRKQAQTNRLEAELDALLRELREHVDSLARLELSGVDSDALSREQTEIRRLRTRIAGLIKSASGDLGSAA